jgi:alkylation response protein AidB-like acyl-CoA dehydrogenase
MLDGGLAALVMEPLADADGHVRTFAPDGPVRQNGPYAVDAAAVHATAPGRTGGPGRVGEQADDYDLSPMSDPRAVARDLAEELLWPAAADIDAGNAPLAPHLDALAEAGLYGLAGPDGDPRTVWAVTEALASGCLSTAFVWVQHQGALRRVAGADDSDARRAWLVPLVAGACRAGVAVSGVRPPEPTMRAHPDGDAWILDGTVPWVTGWGLVDVLLTTAVSDDGYEVWVLLDAAAGPTMRVAPLPLIAADASRTVNLTVNGARAPADRVVRVAPYVPPPPTDGGGRTNGSFALGVAARACDLMGPSPLDGELTARRAQLDAADEMDMAEARAAAIELALRATARLVVVGGGRSVMAGGAPARLAREALFTAVFGSRRAIRGAVLERLDRAPDTRPASPRPAAT